MTAIPHLLALQDRLTYRDDPDSKTVRRIVFTLEQLPYTLDSARAAVVDVMERARGIAAAHDINKMDPGFVLHMSQAERNSLAFGLDAFFDSAVRTQNAMLPWIGRALRMQLPLSMSDFMKSLLKGKRRFPQELGDQLYWYWTKQGERLRAYRDLAQHFAVVASEGTVTRDANGAVFMYLALPNNPEVKSVDKLLYADPVVFALPYVLEQLRMLFAIVYRVTALLREYTDHLGPLVHAETFAPRDPFLSSARDLHSIPEDGKVESELEACVTRQHEWFEKRASRTAV